MTAPARVTLSESTTNVLRHLASKTGLTNNLIARLALVLSFEQRALPAQDSGPSGLTINRATLFGEIEPFLLGAFQVSVHDSHDPAAATHAMAAHIARGAKYLQRRVNSVSDLVKVLVE